MCKNCGKEFELDMNEEPYHALLMRCDKCDFMTGHSLEVEEYVLEVKRRRQPLPLVLDVGGVVGEVR